MCPVENGEQVIGSLPSVDEFSARVAELLAKLEALDENA